jgi:hypothetical protein
MMEKVQMQIQVSAEVMEALEAAAGKMGVSRGILARLILHEHFGQSDEGSKAYTLTPKNWREIEAYVEAKRLGSVEVFAEFAMERYMAQYYLKTVQKRAGGKNIDEWERGSGGAPRLRSEGGIP